MTWGPLAAGLSDWFRLRRGCTEVSLGALRRPSGGFSSETLLFDVALVIDGVERHESLVLRTGPRGAGTFAHHDLAAEVEAQQAAAASGVAIAEPTFEPDARWIGRAFIVMPHIDGHIVAGVTHSDPWLRDRTEQAQHELYRNVLVTLSQIHRSDTRSCPGVPRRDNATEVDYWEDYLDWSSGGSPVATLVDALSWCRRTRPAHDPEPALLWGDVRFENIVFGDDLRPRAVLDWDMTSIGAPEHDLAWFTSLDATMERLFARRLPGFPGRREAIAIFEALSGRPVRDFEWYETLAMVRSTAIMTRISYLRRDAGEDPMLPIEDNPLLDHLRERLGPS